jgi:hypothetical protein
MTILYSNGCSYTANKNLQDAQRYPSLIANHFGWELMDRSHPGCCNDRIIRCTMRDCIELLAKKQNIVATVQLTHPERTEYAGQPTEHTQWKYWHDHLFESLKPNSESGLPENVADYLRLHQILYNQQASMTKLMVSLTGLASFFTNNNIKFLIFAGPEHLNKFQEEEFYGFLSQDSRILDLKSFNMLSLTGKQEHPDPQGMIKIADFLITTIEQKKY